MCKKEKSVLVLLFVLIVALSLAGCGVFEGNLIKKQTAASVAVPKSAEVSSKRALSWSPEGNIELRLGEDNNLYLADEKGERLIYRNYEKDRELFKHPYSLWSFDFFRIQWSDDGKYVYIIDSIYDVTDERLIPLESCVVFSWSGNKGIYLYDGKIVEGKFWDNGFYGLYTSKCIKGFEAGKVKTIKELTNDRYFVVSESNWDETEKTLFRCLGPGVEVKTAKFKFEEEEMNEKLMRAYQELREDEKAWNLLMEEYVEADSRNKALNDFEKLRAKYPVKLVNESFEANHLSWDFDMNYYIVDIKTEKIG